MLADVAPRQGDGADAGADHEAVDDGDDVRAAVAAVDDDARQAAAAPAAAALLHAGQVQQRTRQKAHLKPASDGIRWQQMGEKALAPHIFTHSPHRHPPTASRCSATAQDEYSASTACTPMWSAGTLNVSNITSACRRRGEGGKERRKTARGRGH